MKSAESSFEATREVLHLVAAHVLARRRFQQTGRFGLRVSPGGISTPMFGSDGECIRTSAAALVRERGATSSYLPISGASLRELAVAVDADIDADFSCGRDTPRLADPDEPLHVTANHAETLARWFQLGWTVLDTVLSRLPASADPATLQLWPEHFDIGTNVALPDGDRVNLGCSAGDRYVAEPYLYLGPWGTSRPGDPEYWNVSFGAALLMSELTASSDPVERGAEFMAAGLGALYEKATADE